MVKGKLQSSKQNGLETLVEVMSVVFCDGCNKVLEELGYERPSTILVGIQVGEQDEEFQTIVPQ